MPTKIDLFKELKTDYATPKQPTLLTTTPGHYLRIEGRGHPETSEFEDKMGALYAVAYTVKMRYKRDTGTDYTVGKLECLWPQLPSGPQSDDWHWQYHIRVPEFITAEHLQTAQDTLIAKKKPATVREVELVPLHEGHCVQMLHIGPYNDEPETVDQMAAHAAAEGYQITGMHHEIYLSDPRRIEPARLKTILRHPVAQRTK